MVLVAFLWDGTFITGRVIVQAIPFMTAAMLRFAVALPLPLMVAWKLEDSLLRLNRMQLAATPLRYHVCRVMGTKGLKGRRLPADERFQSAQQISEHKFRHMRKPFRLGFRLLEIASEYRRQGMPV